LTVIGSEGDKVRWSVTVAKEYQTAKVPLTIVWKWCLLLRKKDGGAKEVWLAGVGQ